MISLTALAFAVALAPPPTATAETEISVPDGPHTVGDRIEVVVTLEAGPEDIDDPVLSGPPESWGPAEVLSIERLGPEGVPGEGPKWTWRLEIAIFRPGRHELPPLAFRNGPDGEIVATTPADLVLEVASVLPDDGEAAPLPPAAPVPLESDPEFLWATGLLAALCLGAVVARRSLRPTGPPAPERPPLAVLELRLSSIDPGGGSEALDELSLALRRYLGKTLSFPATERTTAEIERTLRRDWFDRPWRKELTTVLGDLDRLRFAGATLDVAEVRERVEVVRRTASSIDESLGPGPEGEDTEDAA